MDYEKQYLEQNMQANAASVLNATKPPALEEIELRVRALEERASSVVATLARHADAVFGPVPENDAKSCGVAAYPESALGRINSALDELDDRMTRIAELTNRNCKLA